MLDLRAHLKALVETHAPSGYEGNIRAVVQEAWMGLVDEFVQDRLGSLIAIKKATRPLESPRKIMLAAHMDEIGLMVRDIVDGFLFVHDIAGIDSRILPAQPVLVHGKQPLAGVVATLPTHLTTAAARKKYPTMNQLVIDVGLPAEKVTELVTIGDLITPDVSMIELANGRLAAKSFDDRACVAVITYCLDLLQSMQHQWDVYATATVQEESGLFGATTAAHLIDPDIAIALDVTFAEQPGVNSDFANEMGDGPCIGIGPNLHPKLNDKIQVVAKQHEIKWQDEVLPGDSGTDAWAIQVAREGIPTALFNIAIRNMHSPVETLDIKDIERSGRLLALFIASLDDDFMATIDWQSGNGSDKGKDA